MPCPTKGYWGEIRGVLNYLKVTKYDSRTIGSANLRKLDTWVAASHPVYEDMRRYIGGCVSYDVGMIHSKASTQKLKTKSTT